MADVRPRGEKITQYISIHPAVGRGGGCPVCVTWQGTVRKPLCPVRRREQDPAQVVLPLTEFPLFPFVFPIPEFAGERGVS